LGHRSQSFWLWSWLSWHASKWNRTADRAVMWLNATDNVFTDHYRGVLVPGSMGTPCCLPQGITTQCTLRQLISVWSWIQCFCLHSKQISIQVGCDSRDEVCSVDHASWLWEAPMQHTLSQTHLISVGEIRDIMSD
jgi:hypothetical protein